MKRILIYTSDSLDSSGFDTIRSLAHRLAHAPGGIELRIVTDMPVHRRAREDPGVTTVTLPRIEASGHEPASTPAARPLLGATPHLRAQIIARAIAEFAPDLIIVDGLPFGRYDELARIIATPWPVQIGPQWVLLLRDLIGCPQRALHLWRERGYFEAMASHYTKVFVCGDKGIFDLHREYAMPNAAAAKLEYCGYIAPDAGRSPQGRLRRSFGVPDHGLLVLVIAGSGADGESLVRNFLHGLRTLAPPLRPRSHIVCGPDMSESERWAAACAIHSMPQVSLQHDSRDTMALLAAADVVLTHGSYRRICEVLALRRRAVIVPSHAAAAEETLRARRLAELGLIRFVSAKECGPESLIDAVGAELGAAASERLTPWRPGGDAIDFVARSVHDLLDIEPECVTLSGAHGVQRSVRRHAAASIALPLRDLAQASPAAGRPY